MQKAAPRSKPSSKDFMAPVDPPNLDSTRVVVTGAS